MCQFFVNNPVHTYIHTYLYTDLTGAGTGQRPGLALLRWVWGATRSARAHTGLGVTTFAWLGHVSERESDPPFPLGEAIWCAKLRIVVDLPLNS